MEDRFEFRVWDTKKKEMLDGFDIALTPEGFGEYHPNFDWPEVHLGNNASISEGWIPMQCTGLRDKNDNLIFEGDVLKTDAKIHPNCKVGFIQGSFSIACSDGRWYPLQNFQKIISSSQEGNIYFEIIGNIYENPDLL